MTDYLSIFGIIGMGGVGKSELALRYFDTHLHSLDAVFWVAANTREQLSEGYTRIAKEVGLVGEERQPAQLDIICELVKKCFKSTGKIDYFSFQLCILTCEIAKSLFLVLDNISSLESLNGYPPNS